MSNSNSLTTQYKIKKEELVLLRSKYQDRTFAEELDYLESLGGDTFARSLSVDYSQGISQSEIPSRKAQYGSADKDETTNHLSYIARKTAEQFEDTTLKAILILSILSIVINIAVKGSDFSNWKEELCTLIEVLSYVIVAANVQKWSEQKFRDSKLGEIVQLNWVWRDGKEGSIKRTELVTGDIVKITPGMKIPADMLFIEADKSSKITTDESNYTGEACPVTKRLLPDCIKQRDEIIASGKKASTSPKDVYSPVLLSGTRVLSGEGKAIVLLVDESSFAERVKRVYQDEGDASRIHTKVKKIVGHFRKIGLGASAIIFLVQTIKFFIERVRTGTMNEGAQYVQFIDFLMTTVTIMIVAAPQSLHLVVTSVLAYSLTKRKVQHYCLEVVKLKDLECLGTVNSICCSINGSSKDYKALKDAGIRLRIVTDEWDVKTITKELTSIEPGTEENVCMTGNEFLELVGDIVCKRCKTKNCDCPVTKEAALKSGREMRVDEIANFDAFARVCDQLHVLSESHSDAKTALVVGLKQKGETVAVIADKTDDISVLRKADVRLALKSSKEIVKEAAGIVLLENHIEGSLGTLVEAVILSRSIYDSIRKFLQFQLTATLVVVSINLVSAITCSQLLLSPSNLFWFSLLAEVQTSFICLIDDDKPSREVLRRKPDNINDDIISGMMLKQILGQALFQLVLSMGGAFSVPDSEKSPFRQKSIIQWTFYLCQSLNLLNCRKVYGEINIFSNLNWGFFIILAVFNFMFVLPKISSLHLLVVAGLPLILIWPVIMKLYMTTRQPSSKAHQKSD